MNRVPLKRIAVAAVATAALVTLAGCGASPRASSPEPSTKPAALVATDASPTPSSVPSTAPSVAPTPTPTPTPTITLTRKVKSGMSGSDVLAIQKRLTALGYWLGTPNGKFGSLTQQAVWALQKAAGLTPNGVVTGKTLQALNDGVRPKAKSKPGSGKVIEIVLHPDLLLFTDNGQVTYILNVSTAGGYQFTDAEGTQIAVTPKGHYKTYRVIDAMHRSDLGLMYRPRYFNGGDAIHGDSEVPNHPVSHGCARVTDAAMDWIWAKNLDPMGTKVWVY